VAPLLGGGTDPRRLRQASPGGVALVAHGVTLRARTLLALLTVVLAALVSSTGGTAIAAPAPEYPTWGIPPFGANDWTCRPTVERPTRQ
jgi:hypothetical protein